MVDRHTVAITGASGFVGRWLIAALDGYRNDTELKVITLGRASSCDVSIDITNADQINEAIREISPTAVVHLAAVASPAEAREQPDVAWRTNFTGTLNIARSIIKSACDCRLIFAGSSESYGRTFLNAGAAGADESLALEPISTYGATKAAADIALGQLQYEGLEVVRFRPFNHTGAGQPDKYVVPAFASQIAKIKAGISAPVISVGNLGAFRDFLDVRDVTRAYALAALRKEVSDVRGKAFNLSSGNAVQISSILELMIELADVEVEIAVSPEKFRKNEIEAAVGDNTAAFIGFDWRPEISLLDTLRDVLEYWEKRSETAVNITD